MGERKSGAKHGKDVTVGPTKDGRWAVKKQGNDKASNVYDTKKPAVDRGRELSRDEHSELIVKGEDGRIQSKDSHGHDPKKRKG